MTSTRAVSRRRAVIAISAFRHDQITSNGVVGEAMLPYGEVMVAALVTRRPALHCCPWSHPGSGRPIGAFVLHLPVTHRPARDGGRLVWGYPKFIADMEFEDSIETMRCSLAEGGRHILTQNHPTRGPARGPGWVDEALLGPRRGAARPRCTHERPRPPAMGARRWSPGAGRPPHRRRAASARIGPEPFLTRRLTELRLAMTYGQAIGPAEPGLHRRRSRPGPLRRPLSEAAPGHVRTVRRDGWPKLRGRGDDPGGHLGASLRPGPPRPREPADGGGADCENGGVPIQATTGTSQRLPAAAPADALFTFRAADRRLRRRSRPA